LHPTTGPKDVHSQEPDEEIRGQLDTDDVYREPTPCSEDIRKAKAGKARAATLDDVRAASSYTAAPESNAGTRTLHTQPEAPGMAIRMRWQKCHDDCLTVLVAMAWREAVRLHWPIITRMTEEQFREYGIGFITGIPSGFLREMICGNVPYAYLSGSNKQIEEIFNPESPWMENSEAQAPCVYMRAFYDTRTGRSLTPNELRQVIRRLSLYAKEDFTDQEVNLVVAIEQQPAYSEGRRRHVKKGRRLFFGGNLEAEDSRNRARQLSEFCNECQQWLGSLSPLVGDVPVVFPFSYVGNAVCFSKRKTQQDSLSVRSSSWLMNLFKVTSQVVLNDGDEKWGFYSCVLGYCVNEGEVAVGEALFTIVLGA
jgi:hypothetical protein